MKTTKILTLLLLLLPTVVYTNISSNTTAETPILKDTIKDTTKVFEVKIDSIRADTLSYCFSAGEIKSIAEITLKYEELRRYSSKQKKVNQDLLLYGFKIENKYNSLATDHENLKLNYNTLETKFALWRKGSFIVVGSATVIVGIGTAIHYARKH